MSKTMDALRAAGFFNGYDVLTKYAAATGADMPVAIMYQPQERGPAYTSAAWVIHRPGFKTDPREGTSRWWEHGRKTFTLRNAKSKPAKLEEAKAWTLKRYGVTEWASIPGIRDDKFPAEVAAWLKRTIKETPVAPHYPPAPLTAGNRRTQPVAAYRVRPVPAPVAHSPQRAQPARRPASVSIKP